MGTAVYKALWPGYIRTSLFQCIWKEAEFEWCICSSYSQIHQADDEWTDTSYSWGWKTEQGFYLY